MSMYNLSINIPLAYVTWAYIVVDHIKDPTGKQEDDLVSQVYTPAWDFDRVYSWQLGAEINIPWYGQPGREYMFAPWRFAQAVCFYPSTFDLRSRPAGPGQQSTVLMQHFASYVRGANGVAGVAL